MSSAAHLRQAIREGRHAGPTAGMAPDHAQANVVIVPADFADEFEAFCRANPRPCPLLERLSAGDPRPRLAAREADLRTDVPRYRVFRHGVPERLEPQEIAALWREDLVGFLLGCSFTFEAALVAAGLTPRHVARGRNVAMYRTNVACEPAGRFAGPLVVSMQPHPAARVDRVRKITVEFPRMHGAPLHVGDPSTLGIADLGRPDFGDPPTLEPGDEPIFWACGVTPQLALAAARPDLAITHSPGCMFVTDWLHDDFRDRADGAGEH